MEIGSLPLSPLLPHDRDTFINAVRDSEAAAQRDSRSASDEPVSVTSDSRAFRARLAARQSDTDRFNLQLDLSRQTRTALETYLGVQSSTGQDQAEELLGLDISV